MPNQSLLLEPGLISPLTIHRSAQDLPFVEMGPGYSAQILHVNLETGLWVSRSRLNPGYRSPRHYHSAEVFGFTNSGTWFYIEQPDAINRPGSYLYEPAGSIHTQYVPEDNVGPVDIWFIINGNVDALDEDGATISSSGAREMLEYYRNACRSAGLGEPDVMITQ